MENRTAIITGASSGIGTATAKLLASKGIKVALAARRIDRLETLKAEIESAGGVAEIYKIDVTNASEMNNMANDIINKWGRIDILINNAGIMPLSFMKNLHTEEWNSMVDVNIKGVLNGVAAVLPNMTANSSGHIINISSVAGRTVFPGAAVYCATKFAVGALSAGLRMELVHNNIRVTVIEPGVVATELTNTITDQEVMEFFKDRFASMTQPLQPKDIAEAILYAINQPTYVNVNEIMVTPTQQF